MWISKDKLREIVTEEMIKVIEKPEFPEWVTRSCFAPVGLELYFTHHCDNRLRKIIKEELIMMKANGLSYCEKCGRFHYNIHQVCGNCLLGVKV